MKNFDRFTHSPPPQIKMEVDKREREEPNVEEGQELTLDPQQSQTSQPERKRQRRERKRANGWGVAPTGVVSSSSTSDVQSSNNGAAKLYIGNLHFDITEANIMEIFSHFGQIVFCQLGFDKMTGKSKGFCFLEFADPEIAYNVQVAMQGFQLAGREIKVGRPSNVGPEQLIEMLTGTEWEHLLHVEGPTMEGLDDKLKAAQESARKIDVCLIAL
eukprot:TRINITY_DN10715_c0_g1_i4.p1 TRINITY_DN10715_c0_g1~~TRINITY_DN10715_c0_g1_i4.p1  ORF type:complete len:215 (-),score=66.90 TRINITY_DN10715_c0_g1_i4:128-772(-)